MYVSSVMSTSWSEYNSLEWHCDEVLFCVWGGGFSPRVAVKRLSTQYGYGPLLVSMPSSSNKRWSITILNSRFLNLKAHTQRCSHRLNLSKEHVTIATVLHWQNIVLIWDTHKGESDLNTRKFRISSWNGYSSQIEHWTVKKVAINICSNQFDSKTSCKTLFWNGNIGLNLFWTPSNQPNPYKPNYLYECLVTSVFVCNWWKHYSSFSMNAMDFFSSWHLTVLL